MGPLRELLAVDPRQALEFFVVRLQDVSEATVDRQELLYNASLLAHYARVSTQPDVDVPAPANLSAVFDYFVSDTTLRHDSLMMETAGAQCLLLTDFSRTKCVHGTTFVGMPSWAPAFSDGRPFTSAPSTKPASSTPSRGASSHGVSATRS